MIHKIIIIAIQTICGLAIVANQKELAFVMLLILAINEIAKRI